MNSCSIIIPALNEDGVIEKTLLAVVGESPLEIIVVDGGSKDRTVELADRLANKVISSEAGRGLQQNAGARVAVGEYLIFLHADCVLEVGSVAALIKTLEQEGVIASCCRQRIPLKGRLFRWLEWGNRKRVEWWQMVYGDQVICLRKNTFEEIGGFPEIKLMEDVELSRKLKRLGKIAVSDGNVEVNPRRWEKRGVIGQTGRNWLFILLYKMGVSADTLARWYRQIR